MAAADMDGAPYLTCAFAIGTGNLMTAVKVTNSN